MGVKLKGSRGGFGEDTLLMRIDLGNGQEAEIHKNEFIPKGSTELMQMVAITGIGKVVNLTAAKFMAVLEGRQKIEEYFISIDQMEPDEPVDSNAELAS